jgi:hypothetical protein
MSACKDLWMDEVENILNEFSAETLSRDEASAALIRKGFEPYEAADMLDAAVA